MSDNNEQESPVAEAQTPVGDGPSRSEFEKLAANNKKLLDEVRNARAALEDERRQRQELVDQSSKAKQQKLVEDEKWKDAYDALLKTHQSLEGKYSDLTKELDQTRTQFQQKSLQQQAESAFAQAGVQRADHMYRLISENLSFAEDGSLAVMDGGVQKPLNSYLQEQKSPNGDLSYMFASSGSRGMGAGTSKPGLAGEQNPYLTGNFMAVCELEDSDPQRAAMLKQQAGRK